MCSKKKKKNINMKLEKIFMIDGVFNVIMFIEK